MKEYIHNALVAFDQFANTVLGGVPDETISARSAKAAQQGKWWGKAMCAWLNWLQPGHCPGAVEGDVARANAATTELENP